MALSNGPNLGLLIHGAAGEEHLDELLAQWRGLDLLVQARVLDKDLTAPPGAPADGDAYIVAAGATDAWATHDGKIARWAAALTVPAWEFFTPKSGWEAFVVDESTRYRYTGAAWAAVAGGGAARTSVTAVASAAGVVTLDYSLGDYFTLTLTENVTGWVVSNPPGAGKGFTLMVQITQDATARTVAKPGTTAGGAALDVSTAAGAVDLLAISSFDNGTTLRSSIAKAFA